MKNKLKKLVFVVIPLSSILLASCAVKGPMGPDASVLPIPRILVKANKNKPNLEIVTPGSPKCKTFTGKDENGCVVADEDDIAWLSFDLKGEKGWEFTEMIICKGKSKATQDCNLDASERAEFVAYDESVNHKAKPDKHGVILIPKGTEPSTKFYLLDQNLKPENYFYTLKACHPDYPCQDTDPALVNRGRK